MAAQHTDLGQPNEGPYITGLVEKVHVQRGRSSGLLLSSIVLRYEALHS